jgi:hypothetical protein
LVTGLTVGLIVFLVGTYRYLKKSKSFSGYSSIFLFLSLLSIMLSNLSG